MCVFRELTHMNIVYLSCLSLSAPFFATPLGLKGAMPRGWVMYFWKYSETWGRSSLLLVVFVVMCLLIRCMLCYVYVIVMLLCLCYEGPCPSWRRCPGDRTPRPQSNVSKYIYIYIYIHIEREREI